MVKPNQNKEKYNFGQKKDYNGKYKHKYPNSLFVIIKNTFTSFQNHKF